MSALPALAIETILLTHLIVSPRHTRRATSAQIRKVTRSIKAFGYNVPILIDRHNRIIAGVVRFEALKALGHTEVLAIRLEHLTPQQVEAFAIAENRLVETGEWDDDMLAVVFKDLSTLDLDFGLDITGFTLPEIDLKIAGLDQGADAADDPDDRAVPQGRKIRMSFPANRENIREFLRKAKPIQRLHRRETPTPSAFAARSRAPTTA